MAEVRAEMVANVWKVLVSEGDHVDEGDTLVILESMKMEIPRWPPARLRRGQQNRHAPPHPTTCRLRH